MITGTMKNVASDHASSSTGTHHPPQDSDLFKHPQEDADRRSDE